jgi:hypothetical protein
MYVLTLQINRELQEHEQNLFKELITIYKDKEMKTINKFYFHTETAPKFLLTLN